LPEASFANVAASIVDSGEALENRNNGFGKPLVISLSQYRFRNAFGVNGFLSPAATSPTENTCMDENHFRYNNYEHETIKKNEINEKKRFLQ